MDCYTCSNKYFDIKVKCSDGKLYFNKYVLQFNSNYFKVLFQEKFSEKDINKVNIEDYSMHTVSLYFYLLETKKCDHITDNDLYDLLRLIDFTDSNLIEYLLDKILNYLFNFMCDNILQPDFVILMYKLVYPYIKKNPIKSVNKEILLTLDNYYKSNTNNLSDLLPKISDIDIFNFISGENNKTYWNIYIKWFLLDNNLNIDNYFKVINTDFINYILKSNEFIIYDIMVKRCVLYKI